MTNASLKIKKFLKNKYPNIKFSVRTSRGWMSKAIYIEWQDGPSEAEVSPLLEDFRRGHFNGITDSYEYKPGKIDYESTVEYIFLKRRK